MFDLRKSQQRRDKVAHTREAHLAVHRGGTMALKRATFFTYGDDQQTNDTREFIEKSGVILDVRDMERKPLNERELFLMLGFLDLRHFLNPMSKSYEKHGLDNALPSREELLKLIVADNTLLRRPIIKTPRLLTVGNDRVKISEMLQIDVNGNNGDDKPNGTTREATNSTNK